MSSWLADYIVRSTTFTPIGKGKKDMSKETVEVPVELLKDVIYWIGPSNAAGNRDITREALIALLPRPLTNEELISLVSNIVDMHPCKDSRSLAWEEIKKRLRSQDE